MNVTFPDDATIQIFVLPSGTPPLLSGPMISEPLLAAPPHDAPQQLRKRFRRRDVLFLGTGALMCFGILLIVQGQHQSAGRTIETARAARSLDRTVHEAEPIMPSPIPQVRADQAPADPSTTVQRLLGSPPTVTPPPGAAAAPVAAAAPNGPGRRNGFGMSD